MALTQESMAGTVRRKARRAQENVKAAEQELVAANEMLKEALPVRDTEAIAQAAERTLVAEEEVREAAHELEIVNTLLQDGAATPAPDCAVAVAATQGAVPAGASGEGTRSLLPYLQRLR
jgi:hypothetical protein